MTPGFGLIQAKLCWAWLSRWAKVVNRFCRTTCHIVGPATCQQHIDTGESRSIDVADDVINIVPCIKVTGRFATFRKIYIGDIVLAA